MTDLIKKMMDDAKSGVATDEEIKTISDLAQTQLELVNHIKQLESDLENAQESLRQVQEFLLPNAMASAGISEFKLTTGFKITIKDDIYGSIRKDFAGQALRWLDTNGLGDIIKHDVSVAFGRGRDEAVSELVEFCEAKGFPVSDKETVHPQTLKATIKEQMARGVQFPEEYFSVHPVRKAIIK